MNQSVCLRLSEEEQRMKEIEKQTELDHKYGLFRVTGDQKGWAWYFQIISKSLF